MKTISQSHQRRSRYVVILKSLFSLVVGILLVSCSSAKQAQTPKTETLKMKGDWQITNVEYEKGYSIKPFHEGADAQCFVGSTWKLIPNNYTGSYTLNGGGSCPTTTQAIRFEVTKDNEFKFKKIMEGEKAKTVTAGYILQLENQKTDSFTLVQNVPFEGKILKVYYNFARTTLQ